MKFLKNMIDDKQYDLDNIGLSIIGFIFLLYMWIIFKFTSFMPVMDDYDVILRFLNQYMTGDTSLKIDLLFAQHGEHRLVFNRIVELLYLKLFGEIDFFHLVLIGNVGWLLSIYLLWRYSNQNQNINIFIFTPVVLMMLAFTHAALMTWAMASIQQYWQLFFALLAIYFLTLKKDYRAYLFLFLAVFTGGGGLVLIPLFVLYYIVHKHWRQLGVAIIIFASILLLYFVILDFGKSSRNPGILNVLLNTPKVLLMYILSFLGNFGKTQFLAMIIGTVLVILSLFKGIYFLKNRPFLAWSILYIFATALLTGLSRAGAGEWQALSSRYAIYSVLLASLIYLGYLDRYKNSKKVIIFGFLVSVSTFIFYYIHTIPLFQDRMHEAETKLSFPSPGHAEGILKRAVKNQIFNGGLEVKSSATLLNLEKEKGESRYCLNIAQKITVCNDKVTEYHSEKITTQKVNILLKNKGLNIEGWVIDNYNKDKSCGIVTLLDGKKNLFYLTRNVDYSEMLNDDKYTYSRLNTHINTANLLSGEHLLEIRTINTSCTGYSNTIKIPVNIQNLNTINRFSIIHGDTMGNIETFSIQENKLKLYGWYVVDKKDASLSSVIIDIDGEKYFAHSGIRRPDVVKAFNSDAYSRAGFSFEFKTKSLSPGKHNIKIFILADDLSTLHQTDAVLDFQI